MADPIDEPDSLVTSKRSNETTLYHEDYFPSSESTAIGSPPNRKNSPKVDWTTESKFSTGAVTVPGLPPKPAFVDRARLASLPPFKRPKVLPPKRDEQGKSDREDIEWPTLSAAKRTEQDIAIKSSPPRPPQRSKLKSILHSGALTGIRTITHEASSRRRVTVYHPPPKIESSNSLPLRPLKMVQAGKNHIDRSRLEKLLSSANTANDRNPSRRASPQIEPNSEPEPELEPELEARVDLEDAMPHQRVAEPPSSPFPHDSYPPSSPSPLAPFHRDHISESYAENRRLLSEVKSTIRGDRVSLSALMSALALSVPERPGKLAMR